MEQVWIMFASPKLCVGCFYERSPECTDEYHQNADCAFSCSQAGSTIQLSSMQVTTDAHRGRCSFLQYIHCPLSTLPVHSLTGSHGCPRRASVTAALPLCSCRFSSIICQNDFSTRHVRERSWQSAGELRGERLQDTGTERRPDHDLVPGCKPRALHQTCKMFINGWS